MTMRIPLTLFTLSTLYTASYGVCSPVNDQCPLTSVSSVVCTAVATCCCGATTITPNFATAITLSGANAAEGTRIVGSGNDNAMAITISGTSAGAGMSALTMDAVRSFTVSGASGFLGSTASLVFNEDNPGPITLSGANAAQNAVMTFQGASTFCATGVSAAQGATVNFVFSTIQIPSTFQIKCTADNSCAGATFTLTHGDCNGPDTRPMGTIMCVGAGACMGTTLNLVMEDSQCTLAVAGLVCGDGTNTNDCNGLTINTPGAGTVTIGACTCLPQSVCTGATPGGSGATCLGATANPTKFPTKNPTKNPTNPTSSPIPAPTVSPVTAAPTSATASPTTAAPTTAAPTTAAPTSAAPTTAAPTTGAPTTAAPTTAAPTSAAPTTAAPTSAAPTTAAPTSAAPTTAAPVTAAPVTAAPITAAPTASVTKDDDDDDDSKSGSASDDDDFADLEEVLEALDAAKAVSDQSDNQDTTVEEEGADITNYEMVLSLSTEALEHLWAIVILFVVFNGVCVWCYYRRGSAKKRYGFETDN